MLTRTHRHLIGWTQLHRQTMTANQPIASGPFANLPYKMLACPVMHGAQRVLGALVLFKPMSGSDFDLRQVRIVELLARRVGYILMNAYDPTTGLLTRPAFEKRAQGAHDAGVTAERRQLRHLRRHRPPARAEREPRHARRRRRHHARRPT